MTSARIPTLILLAATTLLVGCGMEAVDTRIQYRSSVGDPYDESVKLPEQKWVCPNLVPLNNRPFNPETMANGEVEDTFGPYVPCNTLLDSPNGTCPTCGQQYHTGDQGAGDEMGVEDSKTIPVKAQPAFVCPYEDCQKVINIGAQALARETGKTAIPGRNYCWHCQRHFTIQPGEQVMVIAAPEEELCPSCKKPVDPTLNVCTVDTCKLKGKVLNAQPLDAPCWRCGGTSMCPNCLGSGSGTSGIFGQTPTQCWYCGETGRCPECDDDGFVEYEGTLPVGFTMFRGGRDDVQPILRRDRKLTWSHSGGGGKKGGAAPAKKTGEGEGE
ncbi:MAG: hypothetical protein AB7N76_18610 [Planctomycetota bacterium]